MIDIFCWVLVALVVVGFCIVAGNLLERDYYRRLAPPAEKQPRQCRTHMRRLRRPGLDITMAMSRRRRPTQPRGDA